MAQRVPLQTTPNQSFSIQFEGVRYAIELKTTAGAMAATVSLDEVVVVEGARFFAGTPLITYAGLEGDGGNFILQSEADALPDWEQFEITQFLFYVTAAELANAR